MGSQTKFSNVFWVIFEDVMFPPSTWWERKNPVLTLDSSIFLIHFKAWPWGSTISGHLDKKSRERYKKLYLHLHTWFVKCKTYIHNSKSRKKQIKWDSPKLIIIKLIIRYRMLHWPVSTGDYNSVLSRKSISGQALDVPVSHHCGFGHKNCKTESWCTCDP